jgi:hypothetical protein
MFFVFFPFSPKSHSSLLPWRAINPGANYRLFHHPRRRRSPHPHTDRHPLNPDLPKLATYKPTSQRHSFRHTSATNQPTTHHPTPNNLES